MLRLKNLKVKKYAKATHNSQGVLDGVPLKSDDGESCAGIVILRISEQADQQKELIIVSRWYGGKNLCGDRFRHAQGATMIYLKGQSDLVHVALGWLVNFGFTVLNVPKDRILQPHPLQPE